jgi:hypothetical protein
MLKEILGEMGIPNTYRFIHSSVLIFIGAVPNSGLIYKYLKIRR